MLHLRFSADLFAVVNALGQNVALRRAITDPSRHAEEKETLLKQLFASRISDKALAISNVAVSNRWSSPSDLTYVNGANCNSSGGWCCKFKRPIR
jgi:F-type H+-transporting ATPase subunit delta